MKKTLIITLSIVVILTIFLNNQEPSLEVIPIINETNISILIVEEIEIVVVENLTEKYEKLVKGANQTYGPNATWTTQECFAEYFVCPKMEYLDCLIPENWDEETYNNLAKFCANPCRTWLIETCNLEGMVS
ncbi:hypothetical protein HOF78_01850 [Candidatus Woesearchaeota archaeon]|jgi:hypothetical protein|nr:hypothetical protein [Candidatus Woesearchaeota archaeon]